MRSFKSHSDIQQFNRKPWFKSNHHIYGCDMFPTENASLLLFLLYFFADVCIRKWKSPAWPWNAHFEAVQMTRTNDEIDCTAARKTCKRCAHRIVIMAGAVWIRAHAKKKYDDTEKPLWINNSKKYTHIQFATCLAIDICTFFMCCQVFLCTLSSETLITQRRKRNKEICVKHCNCRHHHKICALLKKTSSRCESVSFGRSLAVRRTANHITYFQYANNAMYYWACFFMIVGDWYEFPMLIWL